LYYCYYYYYEKKNEEKQYDLKNNMKTKHQSARKSEKREKEPSGE
jgi:hypothetical protein